MKKRSSKASAAALFQLALPQQGFFTSKQAKQAGYTDAVHGFHVQNGDWERCYRGIYRLVMFPPVPNQHLLIWSLWSRGRNEQPKAVFSHETAELIHQGKAVPEEPVHLTVPSSFRKGSEIPAHLVLHKTDLAEEDIVQVNGVQVTSRERTRKDLEPAEPPAPGPSRGRPGSPVRVQAPPAGWAAWE